MFFKKKDDFQLKTEENNDYFKYEDDDDFFKYDNVDTDLNTSLYKATNNSELYSDDNYEHDDSYNYYEDDKKIKDTNGNIDESYTKIFSIIGKVVNVVLIFLIVISVMVFFDVIMLTRFSKGPFFAIKTHEYKDGGTKVYNGLFYKVIKYNTDSRKDIVVGDYSLTYSLDVYNTNVVDLAIKARDNYDDFSQLVGKYMNIKGEVMDIDKKNKTIKLIYNDSDKKYQTIVTCKMDSKFDCYGDIEKNDDIIIMGTFSDFDLDDNILININNCFVK